MQEAERREVRLVESAHAAAALQERTHEARQLGYDQEHARRRVRAKETRIGIWACSGCHRPDGHADALCAAVPIMLHPRSLSLVCTEAALPSSSPTSLFYGHGHDVAHVKAQARPTS